MTLEPRLAGLVGWYEAILTTPLALYAGLSVCQWTDLEQKQHANPKPLECS